MRSSGAVDSLTEAHDFHASIEVRELAVLDVSDEEPDGVGSAVDCGNASHRTTTHRPAAPHRGSMARTRSPRGLTPGPRQRVGDQDVQHFTRLGMPGTRSRDLVDVLYGLASGEIVTMRSLVRRGQLLIVRAHLAARASHRRLPAC